jgi:hypothetical protein
MPSYKKHLILRGRNIGGLQGVPITVAADQETVQPRFVGRRFTYSDGQTVDRALMDDATIAKLAEIKDLMDRKSLILQAHSAGHRKDEPKTSWWCGDFALSGSEMAVALEDAYTRVAQVLAEDKALRAEKRNQKKGDAKADDGTRGLAAWKQRAGDYTDITEEFLKQLYFPGVQVLHLACCTGATPDWVTAFGDQVVTDRKAFNLALTITVAAPRDYVVYKPGLLTTQAFEDDYHRFELKKLKGYGVKDVDEVMTKRQGKKVVLQSGIADRRSLLSKGEMDNLRSYNEVTAANTRLWALRPKPDAKAPFEQALGRLRVAKLDPSVKEEEAAPAPAVVVEGVAV